MPAATSQVVLLEKGDVDVALKNEGVIAYLNEATDNAMLKVAFKSKAVRLIRRSTGAKVDVQMDKLYKELDSKGVDAKKKLDGWTEDEERTISAAAKKRADDLAREVRPEFPGKLDFLQGQVDAATKSYTSLKENQARLEGKQTLLAKAMAQVVKPSAPLVERLAGYINEALWAVYGGAGLIVMLLIASIAMVWRANKAK